MENNQGNNNIPVPPADPADRPHFDFAFPAIEDQGLASWNRGLEALGLGIQAAAGAGLMEVARENNLTSRQFALNFGANNANCFTTYLSQSPVYRHFRLMETRIYPFSRRYDDEMIPIIGWIFGNFRAERAHMRDMSNKIAISVGEAYAPMVPATKIEAQGASRQSFLACMKETLQNVAVVEAVCASTPELYADFIADENITALYPEAVDFEVWPPTEEEIEAMVALGAMKVLYFLATCTREPRRTISIRLYAHCFIALTKQGNVSQAFEEKIVTAVREEFAVNIAIDTNSLGIIFRSCLSGVNAQNAGNIFGTLHHMLPEHALRFRLTISQAAFHNHTGLTILVRPCANTRHLIGRKLTALCQEFSKLLLELGL